MCIDDKKIINKRRNEMYKRMSKFIYETGEERDYGYLSEQQIKAQTKGFSYSEECGYGVYKRKGCKFAYIVDLSDIKEF